MLTIGRIVNNDLRKSNSKLRYKVESRSCDNICRFLKITSAIVHAYEFILLVSTRICAKIRLVTRSITLKLGGSLPRWTNVLQ